MAPTRPKSSKKPRKGPLKEQPSGSLIPLELQQLLLNVFKDSFAERLGSDFKPLLQEVKGHLFNRDFLTAFGRDTYLEVYAARWSPSRALAYLQVLADLKEFAAPQSHAPNDNSAPEKLICIGGGAGAELVALGGYLKYVQQIDGQNQNRRKLDVVAVDIADWSSTTQKLHENLVTAPPLSRYAAAATQAANAPLLHSEDLSVTFLQHDILTADFSAMVPSFQGAKLVTILFTLNELYSTSLSLTQRFLLNLTACLEQGALLLVIDSPGSYSTITLNGAEKKYPMQWLLDHTLLKQGPKGEDPEWAKVTEDESKWFRLPTELKYPIELENMRFQLHLYKRAG